MLVGQEIVGGSTSRISEKYLSRKYFTRLTDAACHDLTSAPGTLALTLSEGWTLQLESFLASEGALGAIAEFLGGA